ncbi:MAG: ATP-binding protein [Bacteroidales bacterium]
MGRKLNIPRKLGLGFGLALAFIIIGSFTTLHMQKKNKRLVDRIVSIYEPSLNTLYDFRHTISDAKMLIKNWVFIDYKSETPSKKKLKTILNLSINNYEVKLVNLAQYWKPEERELLNKTLFTINDSLVPDHFKVMHKLVSFDDYNDPMKLFDAISMVQEEDDHLIRISNNVLNNLDKLIDKLSAKFEYEKKQMESSHQEFRSSLIIVDSLIIVLLIISAAIISFMIVGPVSKLKKAASEVGKGNFKVRVIIKSGDEIEVLGNAFNRMAASLEKQREELERTNTELSKSKENLATSNATKDKFFSILAHDLRAPFNAFISVSDILANHPDKLPENKKENFIKSIYATAVQINNLLENLLHWSRSQTNRIHVNFEVIDLEKVIDENLKLLAIPIRRKELITQVNIEDRTFALADLNLTSTIIRNLMSNAVKFNSDKGKVIVNVTSLDNDFLKISVQDTGIGLSEEDIQKLFRIDIDTKYIGQSTAKGTGLGLILCKEFAESNGGVIWVDSEEGVGSTFNFTLKKHFINYLE